MLLRPRTGAVSVGVTWPETARRAVPVVLLLAPDGFAATSRAEYAGKLSTGAGVVVADLRCGGRRADQAGRIDEAELDAAEYTLRWLADHARELGGSPTAIVMVSLAGAAETGRVVSARAEADGWPPVAGHVQFGHCNEPGGSGGQPCPDPGGRIVTEVLAVLAPVTADQQLTTSAG